MSVPFDSRLNLVVVNAKLWGPNGDAVLRLALDTGSTSTMLNVLALEALGYDLAQPADRIQVATCSGIELAPVFELERIDALENSRRNLRVVCHTLPSSTRLDGLLGLDFFRGQTLILDFRGGEITLH